MTRFILLLLSLPLSVIPAPGHGLAPEPPEDEARKITFPDTETHLTLVFDPHTHSVFSDGHVWPKIRVAEALRDGLDAFAVTEHLEYQPHLEDIPHKDRNRSYEEAANAARYKDLMVIPGAEITRSLPASHMNAIFVKDANKLYSVPESEEPYSVNEFRDAAKEWPPQNAVEAANEQGAFVFWNHSWWGSDFPNGIPVVSEFHQENMKKGLLHGIEIANGKHYSEDAFQIALDNDLTLIGVSDVHDLIDWDYEPHKGGHRPVTLVFAEERSPDSIKEALFDRRTVVWFRNYLIGRERDLQPLLDASLTVEQAVYQSGDILTVTLANHSDADFHLRNLSRYGLHERAATFTVPQHSSVDLRVRTGTRIDDIAMEFEVLNAFVAPNETARIEIAAEVESGETEANMVSPLPRGDWSDHGLNTGDRHAIRLAFQRGIDEQFIPGGSLMIIHKGEVILHEGFGVADLETGKPFEANAPCRIASLTKPHTTTTLALLAEQGKLSFQDPVSKYLPAFRNLKVRGKGGTAKPITLAMCLSHTAGFASNNQLKAGEFSLDFNGTLEEVVDQLAKHELFYEPATAYGYGRLGYMVAARVAEVVTGKPFDVVMKDVLFKTLGSTDSTFDYESVIDRIPSPYVRTKEGFELRTGEPIGTVINPGGSLVATPTDVARMLLLHRNRGKVDGQQVVSESILQQMYESQPGRGKAKYGLGFNILSQRSDGSASRIQHTGASGTIGIIDFDLDLIVIALTQVPQAQTNKWRGPMLKTVFSVFENR